MQNDETINNEGRSFFHGSRSGNNENVQKVFSIDIEPMDQGILTSSVATQANESTEDEVKSFRVRSASYTKSSSCDQGLLVAYGASYLDQSVHIHGAFTGVRSNHCPLTLPAELAETGYPSVKAPKLKMEINPKLRPSKLGINPKSKHIKSPKKQKSPKKTLTTAQDNVKLGEKINSIQEQLNQAKTDLQEYVKKLSEIAEAIKVIEDEIERWLRFILEHPLDQSAKDQLGNARYRHKLKKEAEDRYKASQKDEKQNIARLKACMDNLMEAQAIRLTNSFSKLPYI